MSMRKVQAKGTEGHQEERIADYLRAHPDFFDRHPDVAADLKIPHACGEAVSLVEYQVAVLRDRNQQLRNRLKALISTARDNEDLSNRLQRLTLALINCGDLDEVFTILYEALRDSFQADRVAIRLFLPPREQGHTRLAEFVQDDGETRRVFEHVLEAENPVCGRLKQDQVEALFGDTEPQIGSGVLMPLGVVERFGVLAIGSYDETRFRSGMGTVFLRQLGEVAAHVIQPHVATS